MNTNPWRVDSIKAFSFLNCPECVFRTKEENLFAYHAAKNHPLSSAFYDKQIEQEKSSIGWETVEYSPDFNSKLEAIQTKNIDESNDPLECIAKNINENLACKEQLKIVHHSLLHDEKYMPSVPKVVEIVPKNRPTCQHCEKELISISKLQTHYEECPNIASLDESFGNDFENINSGADEAHEDFADESLADESLADDANGLGNIGIKDELSESETQTAILKNPIDVKKKQNERRKTKLDSLPRTKNRKSEIKKPQINKEEAKKQRLFRQNLPPPAPSNQVLSPPLPAPYNQVPSPPLLVPSNKAPPAPTLAPSSQVLLVQPPAASVNKQDIDLPHGWVKRCSRRKSGPQAGRWDFVLYPPVGNQIRRHSQLREFLDAHPDTPHDASVTHFRSPWTINGASAACGPITSMAFS